MSVSDLAGTMSGVTETPTSHHVRQGPRKRSAEVTVADFTTLVRIPTKPATFRAFTADEEAEARSYAEQNGGEPLCRCRFRCQRAIRRTRRAAVTPPAALAARTCDMRC